MLRTFLILIALAGILFVLSGCTGFGHFGGHGYVNHNNQPGYYYGSCGYTRY